MWSSATRQQGTLHITSEKVTAALCSIRVAQLANESRRPMSQNRQKSQCLKMTNMPALAQFPLRFGVASEEILLVWVEAYSRNV